MGSYDDASRLLSIFHQAGPETLSSFEYTYDRVGNRVRVVENMVLPEAQTPTPTETPTPEVTPTPAPRVADFVLLGQEGVWVEQNGQVLSGDVGANVASAGPYLADSAEVAIGIGADILDPAAVQATASTSGTTRRSTTSTTMTWAVWGLSWARSSRR
jgi:hypothetical protein